MFQAYVSLFCCLLFLQKICEAVWIIVGDLAYNDAILHLYRVDEEGKLELYEQLQPPTHVRQDTFAGAGWILYRLPRSSESEPLGIGH